MNPAPWQTLLDMLLGGAVLMVLMVVREGVEIWRLRKPVSRETLRAIREEMK